MGYPVQNIYDYKVVAVLAPRPITVDDMIQHLRLDSDLSTDPAFISEMESYIDSAIRSAEEITKRTIQESRFNAYLDCFFTGRNKYEVRRSPLQDMETITYLVNNVQTAYDNSRYVEIKNDDFSRIQPIVGDDWPTTVDDIGHAIEFTFTAGYKENKVPADLLTALKMHISAMWVNRGDCSGESSGSTSCSTCPIPAQAKMIYSLYRIMDIRIGL